MVQAAAEHKGSFDEVTIAANMATALGNYPQLLTSHTVAPDVLQAGDCSIHSGMVMHAAGPNMTTLPRRAMTVQVSDGAVDMHLAYACMHV